MGDGGQESGSPLRVACAGRYLRGRDCVKSLRSFYTGLYPQSSGLTVGDWGQESGGADRAERGGRVRRVLPRHVPVSLDRSRMFWNARERSDVCSVHLECSGVCSVHLGCSGVCSVHLDCAGVRWTRLRVRWRSGQCVGHDRGCTQCSGAIGCSQSVPPFATR